MPEIRVALVSPLCELGAVESNLNRFAEWTRKAAGDGARFVGFPEMAISGYAHESRLLPCAEAVPGPSVAFLEQLAAELLVYISAGTLEKDGEGYHNTQVLVGPDGYMGKYRKHFPTQDERDTLHTDPGTEYPVFDLDGITFGINICADSREIETIAALADQGVELVHSPHANVTPHLGTDAESWTRGKLCYYVERCLRCRAHILLNNIAGTVPDFDGNERTYASGCMILDPLGQVVARSTEHNTEEKMIVETINTDIERYVPPFEAWREYMQKAARNRGEE